MNKQAMRNGQNKRMRGRNSSNRKGQNPLTRIYESNGPDVKIRGTASHVAEKYVQLARDAQTSGDPVAAENYFQHAEHYFRMIAAAQEQFRQSQPYFRPEGGETRDDSYDDMDDDQPMTGAADPPYSARESQAHQPREGQSYSQRDAQPYAGREGQPYTGREGQPYAPREQRSYPPIPQTQGAAPARPEPQPAGDVERLPAFITGSGPQPPQPPLATTGYGQPNGFEGGQPDRFPLHRRRRRRHGPRGDLPAGPQQGSGPAEDTQPPGGPTSE